MDKIVEALKKIITKPLLLKAIPIAITSGVLLALFGSVYVTNRWTTKAVNNAVNSYTSAINISEDGTISSYESALDLWNEMISKGYPVNQYLDGPDELLKLMYAEMVTRLPDTREDVTVPIDWEEVFSRSITVAVYDKGGSSGIDGVPGQVYDYLLSKGVPAVGAAAIMGNIEHESNFDPTVVNDIGCTGLCQWYEGRLDRLKAFASNKGTDWKDVNTQLDYLWEELNQSYTNVRNVILAADSENELEYATWYWGSYFEVYDTAAEEGYYKSKNWEEEKERFESAKKWYAEWQQTHVSSGSGNISIGGVKSDAEAEALTKKFNEMLHTEIHSGGGYGSANPLQQGPFPKWWTDEYTGLDRFQCTWWAYGRASMYLDQNGTKYKKYPGGYANGGDYYQENINGGWFKYGKSPRPNSIISWTNPGEAGHVAYVEGVTSDAIYISHAGSGVSWRGVERISKDGSIWPGYILNGYIYLDQPN